MKQIINGEVRQTHLCQGCAQGLHMNGLFAEGFGLEEFLGSVLGNAESAQTALRLRCDGCGCFFEDIARSGKVGCAKCYTVFLNNLLPTFQKIHSNTTHCGRIPASAGKKNEIQTELGKLKKQLDKAVKQQEYEQAAKLRDRIREIEVSADA